MTTDGQPGHAGLGIQRVGAALLIWRGVRPGDGAVWLARGLAPEPGRTAVVVDAPATGPDLWPALVSWLAALPPQERGSLRLVASGAGAGVSVGQPGPAQWLADRLGAEVVAPDGAVLPVAGGWMFAAAFGGGGGWWAFRPGVPPLLMGLRHPTPPWERLLPPRALHSATGMVAEPIPAGLWVHVPRQSPVGDPVFGLQPDPARVAVVMGGRSEPPVNDRELRELLSALPADLAAVTVVLPYHRVVAPPPAPAPARPPAPGPAGFATPVTPAPLPPAAAPRPHASEPLPVPATSHVPVPSAWPREAAPAPETPPRSREAAEPARVGPVPPASPVPPAAPEPARADAASEPVPAALKTDRPGLAPQSPDSWGPGSPLAARASAPPDVSDPVAPPAPPAPRETPPGPALVDAQPTASAPSPESRVALAGQPPPTPPAPAEPMPRPEPSPADPVRAIDGGIVISALGGWPRVEELAPWWRPVAAVFAVVIRFERRDGAFLVGDRLLGPADLGEVVARRPGWRRRQVLLVSDQVLPGWVVQ